MKQTTEELVADVRSGKVRALARMISLIEDEDTRLPQLIDLLYPHTGKAFVIGITGSPGVGKSTLVDSMVDALAEQGKRVAVLAVDPSSPYTGGALLGDRIRMASSSARPTVFIRSMASRGALGGLAPRTAEAIFACDAAGFDVIIVETVGVGQAEVEIVKTAHSVVVVLVPGLGDAVQALKAGIIEIADVFAINKSDYPGVDRLQKDLVQMLSLGEKSARRPKIVRTIAERGEGTAKLIEEIEAHRRWASESGVLVERQTAFLRNTLEAQLGRRLLQNVLALAEAKGLLASALDALLKREKPPGVITDELIRAVGPQIVDGI